MFVLVQRDMVVWGGISLASLLHLHLYGQAAEALQHSATELYLRLRHHQRVPSETTRSAQLEGVVAVDSSGIFLGGAPGRSCRGGHAGAFLVANARRLARNEGGQLLAQDPDDNKACWFRDSRAARQ